MGDQDVKEDYERIHKLMSRDRLARAMFNGFETVVTRNVEKLKKYDFDILVCIPVKYETDIHNIFINLSKIDLPLKTTVILGCEKDRL